MPSSQPDPSSIGPFSAPLGVFAPAMEYMVDAAQRSVLFWDVMRQRGNQYREHLAETVPFDTEAALAALPSMLPDNGEVRRKAFDLIKQVMSASGPLSDEDNKRMQRVAGTFGLDEAATTVPNLTVVASTRKEAQAKAS